MSVDRRVRRTKERLRAALMSLIIEKGYDRTTVQDLIDKADVGRSTFYAHYETKDDLLTSTLDRLTADIELHLAEDPSADEAILPSLGVFRHVADNHDHYRALIGSKGIDLVHRITLDIFETRARNAIEARPALLGQADVPPDVAAAFVAGALLAFVAWWIDNDMPYPAETMAEAFRQLTTPA